MRHSFSGFIFLAPRSYLETYSVEENNNTCNHYRELPAPSAGLESTTCSKGPERGSEGKQLISSTGLARSFSQAQGETQAQALRLL